MAVYFMRRADGAVKIGHSQNVKMRAKHILYHLDEDYIDIIRTVPGTHLTATWFHRHFSDLHIEGEWYHFHKDMKTLNAPEEPTLTFRSWADWLHFQSD